MTKPILLTDEDVYKHLTPTEAVAVMENVFRVRGSERYSGAPRWELPFGTEGRMVFTVGAVPEGVGFRAYVRGKMTHDDQLVAVWDRTTGRLLGLIVGEGLGVMRTGAIGGVGVKYMARPNASVMALIGTGRQAYSQLRAIASQRSLDEVRVFSRTPEHREAFAEDVRQLIPNLRIDATDTAEKAVRGADLVIVATTSKTPVVLGEWLSPGAHITTLGPKGTTIREIDAVVVERAGLIASDSPEQERDNPQGSLLEGTSKTLHDLSEMVQGRLQRPSADAITLFISTGLAGTEVALGSRLIEKVMRQGNS